MFNEKIDKSFTRGLGGRFFKRDPLISGGKNEIT